MSTVYTLLIKPSSVIIYEPNNTCPLHFIGFCPPDYVLRDLGHFYDFDRLCTTYIRWTATVINTKTSSRIH
jgi:hypothetical protein